MTMFGTTNSLSPFALLAPAAAPGLEGVMAGDARLDSADGRRHDVEFRVAERHMGDERSGLRYQVTTPKTRSSKARTDRFESTSVGPIRFSDDPAFTPGRGPKPTVDTVVSAGEGRWNGAAGYTFEARAIDAGEPGRLHDRFAMTIRDRLGAIVTEVDGPISAGNIQSRRLEQR
jgi:hypothetical protein